MNLPGGTSSASDPVSGLRGAVSRAKTAAIRRGGLSGWEEAEVLHRTRPYHDVIGGGGVSHPAGLSVSHITYHDLKLTSVPEVGISGG
ncbi:hypothetical protein FRX31_033926 [Thalictrum thalictroides]|uniref:Uncharacterized protein n=1 Tax=Thalictrum thalictroides TaxID=46969 RepID=A0A7J6UV94_THATH|nr:hypothetical protein FRX31_033926 [Thalictrum thalictroides]